MPHHPDTEIHMQHVASEPRWKEDGVVVVPLVDEHEAGRVYDPSLLRWALWGALFGGLLLGWLGYELADGGWTVTGLGQWAASGTAVGATTGGGLGIALGGLLGALLALYRMPPRRLHQHEQSRMQEKPAARGAIQPSPDGR